MKKPSANERADASRLVTGARSHCLSANHLAREGQVGVGVDPNSKCRLDCRINQDIGQGTKAQRNQARLHKAHPTPLIFSKD
jgi:hypothetical protein